MESYENKKVLVYRKLRNLLNRGPILHPVSGKIITPKTVDYASLAWGTRGKSHRKLAYYTYQNMMQYDITRRNRYMEYEMMEQCIAGDTKIAIPGKFIEIQELAKLPPDQEFIVYSYDHKLGKIIPTKAKHARMTQKSIMTYKITFDNGKVLVATEDHLIMLRDGSYRKVKDLKENDSCMPFYEEMICDKEINNISKLKSYCSHGTILESAKKFNGNENKVCFDLDLTKEQLETTIKSYGIPDWKIFNYTYNIIKNIKNNIQSENLLNNHKVVSVEPYKIQPAYDLTVPGYKNFATDTIIVHNTPEISAALDIYADDATINNEEGTLLNIESEDSDILELLENLFYDVLNIDFNLYSWVRNTCKFGDYFLLLDVVPDYGVIGMKEVPPIDIERDEGYDENNINAYRFKIATLGNEPLESYEVAHFRLLSDTLFLPYGKSVLENARRIWKQVCLLEDAMIVYRITRAPERRVFKIDVGNIPPKDIPAYMELQKNQLKRTPVIDRTSGRVDLRFNPLSIDEDFFVPVRSDKSSDIVSLPGGCLSLDTKIPLLNGGVKSLSALINEFNSGKNNYVFSCNPETGEEIIGNIAWAGITHRNAEVLKITLDNNEELICTPDHKFPVYKKGFVEAKNLDINDDFIISFHKNLELKNLFFDHKIKAIEYLSEKMDVGTLTIDNDYHTFALDCGIFTKNSNQGDIEDVQYLQAKLIASLKIPKAYLSFEEDLTGKSTLAQEDVRHARSVERIQRSIETELKNIAKIHLYSRGISEDRLYDYDIHLTNPSTISEQLKLDLLSKRIGVVRDYKDSGMVSTQWLRKNIMNLSIDEMKIIDRQIVKDKKFDVNLQQLEQSAMNPEGGGGAGGGEGGMVNSIDQLPAAGEEEQEPETEETSTQEEGIVSENLQDDLGSTEASDISLLLSPKQPKNRKKRKKSKALPINRKTLFSMPSLKTNPMEI